MPAHVLYGDSFLVGERLKELEAAQTDAPLLDANLHRLTGSRTNPQELVSLCNVMPFLDPLRFIVVEGLLGTFETRTGAAGGRRAGGRQTQRGAGDWAGLSEIIPNMPDTTCLVFTDGLLSQNNALLRALQPHCEVHAESAPTRENLAVWIRNRAQAKGSAVAPQAVNALANLVNNDLWTLDRELEKLSLYCGQRPIEEEDVRQMVAQVREASIFGAVDAILEGNPGLAVELLRQLARDGRDPSYIITMVARQLRLIALAKDLTQQGMAPNDVGSQIGVTAQYPLRKTLEQSRRLSWDDLNRRYRRLLDADLAIKRGRQEPDAALELMVADLSGGARRRG